MVITKDIELDDNTLIFKENFTSLDFNSSKFIDNKKKIIFLIILMEKTYTIQYYIQIKL